MAVTASTYIRQRLRRPAKRVSSFPRPPPTRLGIATSNSTIRPEPWNSKPAIRAQYPSPPRCSRVPIIASLHDLFDRFISGSQGPFHPLTRLLPRQAYHAALINTPLNLATHRTDYSLLVACPQYDLGTVKSSPIIFSTLCQSAVLSFCLEQVTWLLKNHRPCSRPPASLHVISALRHRVLGSVLSEEQLHLQKVTHH